jgi:S-adenosylmethionine:tRNA ribosyltransferase-isomerase
MKASDFDFTLPPERIAAYPAERRDGSALMVLDRATGDIQISQFKELRRFLPARCLLVLNETRVFPARIHGQKQTGGRVELLLLRRVPGSGQERGGKTWEAWEALARGLGHIKEGTPITFEGGLTAEVVSRGDRGAVRVGLSFPKGKTLEHLLAAIGEVPLPPYIVAARAERNAGDAPPIDDVERYQTVYASVPGAVAAPTAGLHFTRELLEELRADGHDLARLVLHVGPGTFRPVVVEDVTEHAMDTEWYSISEDTAQGIARARAEGRPIVAVGTTVVRALEAAARAGDGLVRAGDGATDLFLRPGSEFKVVTDLITNFHLPRSTLLMLVAALTGRDAILSAYERAIREGFRFYSYGDAMLIRGTR